MSRDWTSLWDASKSQFDFEMKGSLTGPHIHGSNAHVKFPDGYTQTQKHLMKKTQMPPWQPDLK